jgi:hypothetical protein
MLCAKKGIKIISSAMYKNFPYRREEPPLYKKLSSCTGTT